MAHCIHIGNRVFLNLHKFVAAVPIRGRKINNLVSEMLKQGKIIDITNGKSRKTLVVTNTGVYFITALSSSGVRLRFERVLVKGVG